MSLLENATAFILPPKILVVVLQKFEMRSSVAARLHSSEGIQCKWLFLWSYDTYYNPHARMRNREPWCRASIAQSGVALAYAAATAASLKWAALRSRQQTMAPARDKAARPMKAPASPPVNCLRTPTMLGPKNPPVV